MTREILKDREKNIGHIDQRDLKEHRTKKLLNERKNLQDTLTGEILKERKKEKKRRKR